MALTKIKTGGITDSAVTTAKINNNAVTDAKVADAITVTAATISGSTLASGVTASSLTSVGTLTGLTVNGATVINENSADVDFRVESNDYANMLVVDGGTNQVGIGNGVASFSTGVLNITNTVVNDRADVIVDTFANNGSASALWLRTSRNTTIGTVTETASGQSIGTIFAHGVDSGGNYDYGAYIDFYQSGGSGTRVPTDIVFWSSTSSAVAEKMRITSAGTVGIQESSPSAALHVVHGSGITLPTMETTARNLAIFEGDQSENYISIASPNTAYAGINFTDTGHKAAGWVQYKHESTATNDYMRFAVNESEKLRITAAGIVHITGASNSNLKLSPEVADEVRLISINDADDTYKALKFYGSRHEFLSGSVGIGTASPGAPLDVQASANGSKTLAYFLNTSQTNDAAQIRVGSGTANKNNMVIGFETVGDDNAGNYGYIGMNSVGNAIFINNNADVGIGTSSPVKPSGYGTTLSLASSGEGPAITFQDTGETNKKMYILNQSGNLKIGNMDDDGGGVTHRMQVQSGGVVVFSGTSTQTYSDAYWYAENDAVAMMFARGSTPGGSYVAFDGTTVHSSDKTLKKNIKKLESPLSTITSLEGKSFNWKDDRDSIKHYGLIAQDVEKILPDIIWKNKEDKMSVNYIELVPILIEAVKELSAEVEELKENA